MLLKTFKTGRVPYLGLELRIQGVRLSAVLWKIRPIDSQILVYNHIGRPTDQIWIYSGAYIAGGALEPQIKM